MDVEAVGDAVTAGLVSRVVERPTGHAGEPAPVCADCGTQTLGRFCHNCGNPSHVHRTLAHLAEELLHGVMHFDGRAWRTLPLLAFRPGRLTREWVEGRRARYVSPLALFLFTIFVMFMAISYLPRPAETPVRTRALTSAERVKLEAKLGEVRADVASAPPAQKAAAQAVLDAAEAQAARAGAKGETQQINVVGLDDAMAAVSARARKGELSINTGNAAWDERIRHKLENPELAVYKLQQTFYKFSFLLVPISLPFVALLFLWKRGVTLYDHSVFILYSLTFMSVLVMAVAALARLPGPAAGLAAGALPFVVPAHMFFQLKGAYGLGVWSALWRTAALLVFCLVAMLLFILAVIVVGLA